MAPCRNGRPVKKASVVLKTTLRASSIREPVKYYLADFCQNSSLLLFHVVIYTLGVSICHDNDDQMNRLRKGTNNHFDHDNQDNHRNLIKIIKALGQASQLKRGMKVITTDLTPPGPN